MRTESLQLIKQYYSKPVYELISIFLDYKQGVDKCKVIAEACREYAIKTFKDTAELVKKCEAIKMEQMFDSSTEFFPLFKFY